MNVLYLTMNQSRRSTTVPTEGWFRFLAESGLRPVLVSREHGPFPDWAADRGIPVYYDPLAGPSKANPLPFARSLWNLRTIVRRHRIDLIHCNEHDVYPVGQYLGRVCTLPVVVSVHFTIDEDYCRWAFRGPKAPRRMFFVTRRSLEACRPALEGVVPESKWRVLHNGLDLERYRPDAGLGDRFRTEHGLDSRSLLVGVACALRPRKQLEHLFEAVSRLPDRSVEVVVAGFAVPGDEVYADELLDNARQRLGERLHFVGALDDLRGFANALDLFVNTSREESFGLSVLEALACGCPAVGYDSHAVDEVMLPDGGEIVEQDNVDELVEVIGRWTRDREWLRPRRLAARRQAERFDLRRLSRQLWSAYLDVLSEAGQGARAGRLAGVR